MGAKETSIVLDLVLLYWCRDNWTEEYTYLLEIHCIQDTHNNSYINLKFG